MNCLDDARRLAAHSGSDGDTGRCIFCGYMPHAPDCPWLSMPRIVAALERLEAMQAAVNKCGEILDRAEALRA